MRIGTLVDGLVPAVVDRGIQGWDRSGGCGTSLDCSVTDLWMDVGWAPDRDGQSWEARSGACRSSDLLKGEAGEDVSGWARLDAGIHEAALRSSWPRRGWTGSEASSWRVALAAWVSGPLDLGWKSPRSR